jgi:hypothetical protein
MGTCGMMYLLNYRKIRQWWYQISIVDASNNKRRGEKGSKDDASRERGTRGHYLEHRKINRVLDAYRNIYTSIHIYLYVYIPKHSKYIGNVKGLGGSYCKKKNTSQKKTNGLTGYGSVGFRC